MTRSPHQTTGTSDDAPLLSPGEDAHRMHRAPPDTRPMAQAHAHGAPEHEEHPEDDPAVRHGMEAESPDGAPPEPSNRRASKMVLTVVIIAASVLLMVPLFIIGGPLAVIIGAAIVVGFFLLGQAPAWVAGLNRKEDRDQVEKRLGHDPKHPTGRR
ncbi:MAG: hypothetical protein EA378_05575 [Phycisphaerales bacterium]|nr:MAG: hypothetical protein EA378_05575 [Phycisphaerales bacterium]